jgi:hypothetical protein
VSKVVSRRMPRPAEGVRPEPGEAAESAEAAA